MFFLLVLVFLFGLAIGSLVNVVVYRTEKKEPFVKGRSRCPKCKKKISWYDNIPLLSFLLLKGRCRKCKKKISWQYPLGELITGALLVWLFAENSRASLISNEWINWGGEEWLLFSGHLIFASLIVGILVSIFIYDLRHYLIPDQFVLFGILVVVFYNLAGDLRLGNFSVGLSQLNLLSAASFRGVLGALLAGGFFFLLVKVSKEKWMGWGDVKFAVFMGLALGFPVILVGLFIAYLLGSLIGLALIVLGKKKMRSEIPFGPFLCAGTYLGMLYGERTVYWYLGML